MGNGKETQVTSRFFTQECTCHYNIDDVADIVIEAAKQIVKRLQQICTICTICTEKIAGCRCHMFVYKRTAKIS